MPHCMQKKRQACPPKVAPMMLATAAEAENGAELAHDDSREELIEGLPGAGGGRVLLSRNQLVVTFIVLDVEVRVADEDEIHYAQEFIELRVPVTELVRVRDADGASVGAKGDCGAHQLHPRQPAVIVAVRDDYAGPNQEDKLDNWLRERGHAEGIRVELILRRRGARVSANKDVEHGEHQDDEHERRATPAPAVDPVSRKPADENMDVEDSGRVVILWHPAKSRQDAEDPHELHQIWLHVLWHRRGEPAPGEAADDREAAGYHGQPHKLSGPRGLAIVELALSRRPQGPVLSEARVENVDVLPF
eukprot:scaffold15228_cov118-Isochrysis_galbana.AAC.8